MKKITKTTEYWFLKPAKHPLYLSTELFYIRIKTSGVEKISWVIGYENDNNLVSRINGGELDPKLVEELEKEFQKETNPYRNDENIKIEDLDISVRCFQALKANNIQYLYMLSCYKPEELHNFSKKSIEEIEYYMNKYGVSWREKEL